MLSPGLTILQKFDIAARFNLLIALATLIPNAGFSCPAESALGRRDLPANFIDVAFKKLPFISQ